MKLRLRKERNYNYHRKRLREKMSKRENYTVASNYWERFGLRIGRRTHSANTYLRSHRLGPV